MLTQHQRWENAKTLLIKQISLNIKPVSDKNLRERPLTQEEVEQKRQWISILDKKLNGTYTKTKKTKTKQGQEGEDGYLIEIYTVKYGYIKNSQRRKLKGQSKKKLKKVKTLSLIQTVKSRPGLITMYKTGLMGLSPKSHVFKVRKIENTGN